MSGQTLQKNTANGKTFGREGAVNHVWTFQELGITYILSGKSRDEIANSCSQVLDFSEMVYPNLMKVCK